MERYAKLTSKLKIGQTENEHTKTMLVTIWKDQRNVYVLTTEFDHIMVNVVKNGLFEQTVKQFLSMMKI